MAFTSDYTGTSIDQLGEYQHQHQHQHQGQSQSRCSLQSKFLNTYLHFQSQPQINQWSSPADSYDNGSRGTSAQLISPTSDVVGEMATTIDEGYQVLLSTKELVSSQFCGHNLNGQGHGHCHGRPSKPSTPTSSSSVQTDFGGSGNVDNAYPIDNNFTSPRSSLNGNLYAIPDLNFENLFGLGYQNNGDNATIGQAAHDMYGTYDFVNYNNTNTVTNGIGNSLTGIDTDQSLPTSAPTRALFQSTDIKLQDIPINQTQAPTDDRPTRSPSPLLEVAEAQGQLDKTSSLGLTEIKPGRRASESTPFISRTSTTSKRRNQFPSINTGASASGSGRRLTTTHVDPEEKALRAAAAEGLGKEDKRRMQNKLAQRAFRARSKVVNKNAAGRSEYLVELTEQDAGRIGTLIDLVGRLQKENYALNSAKFQEMLMKGGMT